MGWQLSGRSVELCSCKMLCPCLLGPEGTPDQGWCGGTLGFDIHHGYSDGIDLDGTKVAFTAEWPGNFFGGQGTARLYIGDSANAEQRRELEAIFSGKKGGLLEGLWGAVISNWLPTETTTIEIGWAESPFLRVGSFGHADADSLKGSDRKADPGGSRPKAHFSLPAWTWPAARVAGGLIRSCASGKEIRGHCTSSTGAVDRYRRGGSVEARDCGRRRWGLTEVLLVC